jgi:hypothetical protein
MLFFQHPVHELQHVRARMRGDAPTRFSAPFEIPAIDPVSVGSQGIGGFPAIVVVIAGEGTHPEKIPPRQPNQSIRQVEAVLASAGFLKKASYFLLAWVKLWLPTSTNGLDSYSMTMSLLFFVRQAFRPIKKTLIDRLSFRANALTV